MIIYGLHGCTKKRVEVSYSIYSNVAIIQGRWQDKAIKNFGRKVLGDKVMSPNGLVGGRGRDDAKRMQVVSRLEAITVYGNRE